MRFHRFVGPSLFAFVLAVAASSCAVRTAPSPERAAQAIRAELDSTAAGWNRGDLRRYMAAYVDSATAMGRTGLVRGTAEIEAGMRRGFWRTGRSPQTLVYRDVEVRMLGADHALVTGQFVLSGGNQPDVTGWFTTIWVSTPAGWRMLHDHV